MLRDRREGGAHFVESNGRLWDHKQAISNDDWDQTEFLDNLKNNDLRQQENISKLTDHDFDALSREIRARGLANRFIFIR